MKFGIDNKSLYVRQPTTQATCHPPIFSLAIPKFPLDMTRPHSINYFQLNNPTNEHCLHHQNCRIAAAYSKIPQCQSFIGSTASRNLPGEFRDHGIKQRGGGRRPQSLKRPALRCLCRLGSRSGCQGYKATRHRGIQYRGAGRHKHRPASCTNLD